MGGFFEVFMDVVFGGEKFVWDFDSYWFVSDRVSVFCCVVFYY